MAQAGLRWARVHADWSLSVENQYGTRYKIPVIVLCSRNRLFATSYINNIANGLSTENLEFRVDEYDIELRKMVDAWSVSI
jgi:hypothetical protein